MLNSDDCKPSSLTYGWFLQACGRLEAPQEQKYEQLERAWNLCCKHGLVSAFVLHRFTGAAPDQLYKKLMKPALRKQQFGDATKERLKFMISPTDLPAQWTANVKRDNENARGWWNK